MGKERSGTERRGGRRARLRALFSVIPLEFALFSLFFTLAAKTPAGACWAPLPQSCSLPSTGHLQGFAHPVAKASFTLPALCNSLVVYFVHWWDAQASPRANTVCGRSQTERRWRWSPTTASGSFGVFGPSAVSHPSHQKPQTPSEQPLRSSGEPAGPSLLCSSAVKGWNQ